VTEPVKLIINTLSVSEAGGRLSPGLKNAKNDRRDEGEGARHAHVGNLGRSLTTCRQIDLVLERVLPRYHGLDAVVLMVGASDGRTYEDEQQFGVSIFDFKIAPSKKVTTSGNHPRFVGYARIPGLGETKP
jgi:hypothetical protein